MCFDTSLSVWSELSCNFQSANEMFVLFWMRPIQHFVNIYLMIWTNQAIIIKYITLHVIFLFRFFSQNCLFKTIFSIFILMVWEMGAVLAANRRKKAKSAGKSAFPITESGILHSKEGLGKLKLALARFMKNNENLLDFFSFRFFEFFLTKYYSKLRIFY